MIDLNIPLVFVAGVLSFLSPCILPLASSHVAYICSSGIRSHRLIQTAFFIVGFTVVFTTLSTIFLIPTLLFPGFSVLVRSISGFFIIVLGLHTMFDFFKVLHIEKRFHPSPGRGSAISSILFGAAFGAGWTPCVGPILTSILLLASSSNSITTGILYLILFSAGLGLPFLIIAYLLPSGRHKNFRFKHFKLIKILAGLLICVLGLFVLLGELDQLNARLFRMASAIEKWVGMHPEQARIIFSLAYAALALGTLGLLGIAALRRYPAKIAICIAVALLWTSLGVLEVTGLIQSSEYLAAWLRFAP